MGTPLFTLHVLLLAPSMDIWKSGESPLVPYNFSVINYLFLKHTHSDTSSFVILIVHTITQRRKILVSTLEETVYRCPISSVFLFRNSSQLIHLIADLPVTELCHYHGDIFMSFITSTTISNLLARGMFIITLIILRILSWSLSHLAITFTSTTYEAASNSNQRSYYHQCIKDVIGSVSLGLRS